MSEEETGEKESFSFVDKRRSHMVSEGDTSADEIEPEKKEEENKIAPESGAETKPENESDAPKPPLDFSTFLLSLYSSAVYYLGGIQDPVSGKTTLDLDLAKQNIEFISILEEKTKGNLTEEEEKLFQHSLYDLRLRYVEASKQK